MGRKKKPTLRAVWSMDKPGSGKWSQKKLKAFFKDYERDLRKVLDEMEKSGELEKIREAFRKAHYFRASRKG